MEQRFPQVRAREIEQRNPTFSGVMEAIPELRRELEAGGATPDNHDVIFGTVAQRCQSWSVDDQNGLAAHIIVCHVLDAHRLVLWALHNLKELRR